MAQILIVPTAVTNVNDCQLLGGASAAASLSDGDAGTGYANNHGNLQAYFYAYSTATPPANFAGSTITDVTISYSIDANPNRGTAYVQLVYNGSAANSAVIGPPMIPGSRSFGSTRPGGGTWSSSNFFQSGLQWAFVWNGDADDTTKQSFCTELTLTVTYTPVTPPVAAFTVSTTTGTSPLSVTFTDQGTNTPSSWLWTFGDSATAISQNPVHVYTTVGTYTVILTETNAGGSSFISTANLITVLTAAASVVAQFTGAPTSGVQNLSVNFYDASTGLPVPTSWAWSFGDSGTSTLQNPVHVYTTVGVYTVTLTATSTVATVTWQTDSEQKTSYITVLNGKPVPLAQFVTGNTVTTGVSTGFRPLTIAFRGSATNAQPTSWGWDFGDGLSSMVEDPTHVYTTVGTFTPVLTVTNAVGTASTTCGPITVNFSTITASYTVAPRMGYIPLTSRFTDQTIGDVNSWAWNFGDGLTSSEQNPVHTYQTAFASVALTVSETGFSDAYDLRHGLTSYWKMEEATGAGDRADFIGSRNLSANASITQVAGKNNFAAALDFGDTLSRATGFNFTTPCSIAGWVKFTGSPGGGPLFEFGFGDGGTKTSIGNDGSTFYLSANNGASVVYDVGNTLVAGRFYHVVMTFNGISTYKMYIDGVLKGTITGAAAIDPGLKLYFGWLVSATYDEVGFYNIAINQDQITGLYNAGDGLFFSVQATSSNTSAASVICPIAPDKTYGYFFEEMKYQLMEPMWDQDVCSGFTDFGGIQKVLDFTQQRLNRFVLETACLRKQATLSAAITDTEDFALPTDLIELLRVEVNGIPHYTADSYQRDRDSMLNAYILDDPLVLTVPGVFGTVPVIKVLYTYLPTAPTVPAPCTCPTPPAIGPWGYFPLPYTLWWIIRYGVMADLFTQAGLRNDPQRAGKCEELFQNGVEIYKLLYRGNN